MGHSGLREACNRSDSKSLWVRRRRTGRSRKKIESDPELKFWHRLASHLGGRTLEYWQEHMSSAEFTQWKAYHSIEPFGFEMENFRMGVVAASVVNVAPRKKGAKALVPSDFYPAKKKGPIKL